LCELPLEPAYRLNGLWLDDDTIVFAPEPFDPLAPEIEGLVSGTMA
jgi:hypothetical protein